MSIRNLLGSSGSLPWYIDGYEYESISKSVATETTSLHSVCFKPDGTVMYVIGAGADAVFQYSLSTAWDVSTATYSSITKSISAQTTSPYGLALSSDGTKMYISSGSSIIYQYAVSTAWDISTATYYNLKDCTAQTAASAGFSFNEDGTKVYLVGLVADTIYQYNLSTAWNIGTAAYITSKLVSSQSTYTVGVSFSPDGTKMYVVDRDSGDEASQWNLSTAWNLATAVYEKSKAFTAQDASPFCVKFNTDGTKMYMAGEGNSIHQYKLK